LVGVEAREKILLAIECEKARGERGEKKGEERTLIRLSSRWREKERFLLASDLGLKKKGRTREEKNKERRIKDRHSFTQERGEKRPPSFYALSPLLFSLEKRESVGGEKKRNGTEGGGAMWPISTSDRRRKEEKEECHASLPTLLIQVSENHCSGKKGRKRKEVELILLFPPPPQI